MKLTPVEWTETAREDLRQIHGWIARDSRVYARRMIARIRKAVDGMRLFPEAAAMVPEWDRPDIREIFEGPYRIVVQVDGNLIRVLTVIHSARLLRRLPAETEPEPDAD